MRRIPLLAATLGLALAGATFCGPAAAHGGDPVAGMIIGGGIGAAVGGPPGAAIGAVLGAIAGSEPYRHRHGGYYAAPGYAYAPRYYGPAYEPRADYGPRAYYAPRHEPRAYPIPRYERAPRHYTDRERARDRRHDDDRHRW